MKQPGTERANSMDVESQNGNHLEDEADTSAHVVPLGREILSSASNIMTEEHDEEAGDMDMELLKVVAMRCRTDDWSAVHGSGEVSSKISEFSAVRANTTDIPTSSSLQVAKDLGKSDTADPFLEKWKRADRGGSSKNGVAAASTDGTEAAASSTNHVPHPTELRRPNVQAPPGAYSATPGELPIPVGLVAPLAIALDTSEPAPEEGGTPPTDLDQPPNLNNAELLVASVVEDTESLTTTMDLPQAENLATYSERKQDRQQLHSQRTMCRLAAASNVLLILVILVLLAVLVPKSSPKEQGTFSVAETGIPSLAPTLGTLEGNELLSSVIPQESLSIMEQDPESPQAKAFQWLQADYMENPSLSHANIKQRFALATLYLATGGDEWVANDNWLNHSAHECEWYNKETFAMMHTFINKANPGYLLDFFPPTEPQPSRCDDNGHYQNLWLDANNLAGSLPDELFMLTSLRTLSLGFNQQIGGTLSSRIGELTNLQGVGIFGTKIGGTIPTEFGALTKLRGLILPINALTGSIPNEIWKLTDLSDLAFNGNYHLKGSIPAAIGNLKRLSFFAMIDCALSGTIPSEIGKATSLGMIGLARNRLSGNVPSEIGLLTNVYGLTMSSNELTGFLPSQLGEMTMLTLLKAGNNHLSGEIPSELGLLTNLAAPSSALELQDNGLLSGTIPTEIGNLKKVPKLLLQNNQLSGPLPSELGLLESLNVLNLGNNSLVGSIPPELSLLQESLYALQLMGNPLLEGTVPQGLCHLNGTCFSNEYIACPIYNGSHFDCTNMLCGSGCPCQ